MITFTALTITSFAGIADRELTLTPGLNILRGDNESGKSTTLSFLRWVLYGYPSSAEKKRLQPLNGSLPSGSLTLIKDGEEYRIHRLTAAGGRDKVKITRLSDGKDLETDVEPGEYFFALPRDAFDQTALVRQGDGTVVDGKKMSQAMNNILFSADESVSVENALKRLTQARISLWHLNRKGGRIAEDTQRLADLRTRLARASEAGTEGSELEATLAEKKKRLGAHREQAEVFRRQLLAHQVLRRREKEALLAERGLLWEQSEKALRDAQDGGLPSGFVPDDAFRAAMIEADRDLRQADNRITLAEAQVALAAKPTGTPEEAALETFRRYGGIEKTLECCRRGLKKSRTLAIFGGIFLIFLIGILLLILSAREKKRVGEIFAAFSCRTLPELEAIASRCAAKTRVREETLASLRGNLDALRGERRNLYERAEALALRAGGGFEQILAQLSDYEQTLNRLRARAREARAAYESTKTLLEGEEPIQVDPETLPELPEGFDPTDANRKFRFYSEQIPLLEKQIHQHQLRLTELSATHEDPATLADRIGEEEKSLRALHEEYDALALAIDALTEASAGLRDNVSGTLASLAASYLSRMTGGRYDTLGVDADLELHTPHPDQNDISVTPALLSEGTKTQAYLALRLALTRTLCPSNPPPLLLDEALVFLDDGRLKQVLALLSEMKDERQVVLFTASGREERAMAQM